MADDLREMAMDGLDLKGKRILEIGPLDRPVAKKGKGSEVFYLDHCSTEDLKAKYADDPVIKKDKIAEIDFVSLDGSVSREAIGDNKFDVILACHVIEHVPNLAKWIADNANALNAGGVLALVIPDRRYTFDYFRRITPKAWIEAAHAGDFKRPGLENVCDHFSNVAHINAADIWARKDVSQAPRIHDANTVIRALSDWHAGGYIDCHSWVFEHDRFKDLMEWLFDRFSIGMKVKRTIPPVDGQLEFYAQLQKI